MTRFPQATQSSNDKGWKSNDSKCLSKTSEQLLADQGEPSQSKAKTKQNKTKLRSDIRGCTLLEKQDSTELVQASHLSNKKTVMQQVELILGKVSDWVDF